MNFNSSQLVVDLFKYNQFLDNQNIQLLGEIDKLEEEKKILSNRIKYLDDENEDLEDELREYDQDLNQIKLENFELKKSNIFNELSELLKQNINSEKNRTENEKLKSENEKLKSENEKLKSENKKLINEINQSNEDLKNNKNCLLLTKIENQNLIKEITTLKKKREHHILTSNKYGEDSLESRSFKRQKIEDDLNELKYYSIHWFKSKTHLDVSEINDYTRGKLTFYLEKNYHDESKYILKIGNPYLKNALDIDFSDIKIGVFYKNDFSKDNIVDFIKINDDYNIDGIKISYYDLSKFVIENYKKNNGKEL